MTRARKRLLAAVVMVTLGVATLTVLGLGSGRPASVLDPDDRGPKGGRALAQVLRAHGVTVTVTRSISGTLAALDAAAPRTSLLIANPEFLGVGASEALAGQSRSLDRLIVAGVWGSQLDAFDLPVQGFPGSPPADAQDPAACSNDVVNSSDRIAGDASVRYSVSATPRRSHTACFGLSGKDKRGASVDSGSLLVALGPDERSASAPYEAILMGAPDTWTNAQIVSEANAAIALRALGKNEQLIWYQPGANDLVYGEQGSDDAASPWPTWSTPAIALILIATSIFLIAAGRRLGRLVPEPLPVLVPAAETTLSRAALYRKTRARDRAAAALREGTMRRLRARRGSPQAPADRIAREVAIENALDPAHVQSLLTGRTPLTDADLVQLASELKELEEKVRAHD